MYSREANIFSIVWPDELILFLIIGKALPNQSGRVITPNATKNNKKNKNICFVFINHLKNKNDPYERGHSHIYVTVICICVITWPDGIS